MDFIDEQRMCALYKKFILEYFKKEHPNIDVSASFINWQLDDGYDLFLPRMKNDITLTYKKRILIIDAKYYVDSMQHHFDKETIISSNLFQIFTYVKNKSLEVGDDITVSGMLLYAKTTSELQPKAEYKMSGNLIYVRTLDLNKPFIHIKEELENIYQKLIY